jgi:[ribosomal protein S5]-alanine N-acetyltransferase
MRSPGSGGKDGGGIGGIPYFGRQQLAAQEAREMVRHLPFCFLVEFCAMPRLETHRLILRPPEYSDAPAITALLGDIDVAKNLITAPHPYREVDACDYVSRVSAARARGECFAFVVLYKEDEALLGACGLNLRDGVFDLGYWIGKPYWGMGIATEAATKVISFAFNSLRSERLSAGWFHDNPASGRVLDKLGFVASGTAIHRSLARGTTVACNRMALTRENFGRKKAA